MSRLQHKRGRKSNYTKSLSASPYWKLVTRKVRLRDGHKCRICGSAYPLEVHHIRYKVNRRSIVGNELDHLDCLVTLCGNCHEKVHRGIVRI